MAILFSNLLHRRERPSGPAVGGMLLPNIRWRMWGCQYVPMCLFVCLSACLSVCLFVCLFTLILFVCLFDFICLSLYVVQRSYESYDIWWCSFHGFMASWLARLSQLEILKTFVTMLGIHCCCGTNSAYTKSSSGLLDIFTTHMDQMWSQMWSCDSISLLQSALSSPVFTKNPTVLELQPKWSKCTKQY